MTQPTPEQLQDLMRRFGYEEKEAEAHYHLQKARDLFDEIFVRDEQSNFAALLLHEMDAGVVFKGLGRKLAMRVLRRKYPEGWGHVAPRDDEEGHQG